MDWNTFAREYSGQMQACARKIHRRWKVPAAVSVEDVHQEVFLAAWLCFHQYDATRGNMNIAAFTLWNAKCAGIAFVNKQRNAPRRSCRARGRFEEGVDTAALDTRAIEPEQFVRVAFAQKLERVLRHYRQNKRDAFAQLVACSFDTRKAVEGLIAEGTPRRAAMGDVRDVMRTIAEAA
jgi:DNA-directed RNA polymerase specialized sigma24 family protein